MCGEALIDHGYIQGECDQFYASVHFQGKVSFIGKLEEKREAIMCMIRHLEKNPEPLITRLNMEKLGRTAIGRVDIQHMTGMKSKKVTI